MTHTKTVINLVAKGLCTLLVFMAPVAAHHTACFLLWGEPECPECLK